MDLKIPGGWTPIRVYQTPSVYPLVKQYGENPTVRFRRVEQEKAEQTAIERQLDIVQQI